MYYNGYNMMPFGFGFGFGWFGAIFMLVWWAIIIASIVLFVRWIIRQGHNWKHSDKDVIEILKERYAKGEIDKLKYEEMKKELEK